MIRLLRLFLSALMMFATLFPCQSQEREQLGGHPDLNAIWSGGQATGKGPVKLTHFPLRVQDIGTICPMGLMVGGHVTPSDHIGLAPKDPMAAEDYYDVLAPADGFIVNIQRAGKGNPDPAVPKKLTGEYLVRIEHSGTFWTYTGLINQLDPAVRKQIGKDIQPGPPPAMRIPVKGGQVIGKVGGGHGLDFAVIDTEKILKGFVRPEHFNQRDFWKIYTVDPFDYVEEPLKSKLLALNPRKAAPRGGKIDYDIDGKLVGNWYQEKTGSYAGLNKRLDYWVGHLSVVYHHIDASKIVVSLGVFDDRPRQFWVVGNAPDPAKVGKAAGLVKYELIWAKIGSDGRVYEGIDAKVQGVVLLQLIEDRHLKVEVFRGQTGKDVIGFSKAALTYER